MKTLVLLLLVGFAWISLINATYPVASVLHGLTIFDQLKGKSIYLYPSMYNGRPAFDHKTCLTKCHAYDPRNRYRRRRFMKLGRHRYSWRKPAVRVSNNYVKRCLDQCRTNAIMCMKKWCYGPYKPSYDVKQCDWWKQCFDKLCHCSESQMNRGPRCRNLIPKKPPGPALYKQRRNSKYHGLKEGGGKSIVSLLLADNPRSPRRKDASGRKRHRGRGAGRYGKDLRSDAARS